MIRKIDLFVKQYTPLLNYIIRPPLKKQQAFIDIPTMIINERQAQSEQQSTSKLYNLFLLTFFFISLFNLGSSDNQEIKRSKSSSALVR